MVCRVAQSPLVEGEIRELSGVVSNQVSTESERERERLKDYLRNSCPPRISFSASVVESRNSGTL